MDTGAPLSAALSKPIAALIAAVFAFGVVGALMVIGWRQRPMLEIPPKRFPGDLPESLLHLSEFDRRRIGVLARSGAPIQDPTQRALLESYCRWRIADSEALSFRRMSAWGKVVWTAVTAMHVGAVAVVVAKGPALLALIFVPVIGFRLLVLTGQRPRLMARRYRRTAQIKFTGPFDEVFRSEGMRIVLTPIRATNANAFCERWVATLRAECLDWTLILGRRHLERVLRAYIGHYNRGHVPDNQWGRRMDHRHRFRVHHGLTVDLPRYRLGHHRDRRRGRGRHP
jgi:hypothetical protein